MQSRISTAENNSVPKRARVWIWLSIVGALLAVAGNIIALSLGSIYARPHVRSSFHKPWRRILPTCRSLHLHG